LTDRFATAREAFATDWIAACHAYCEDKKKQLWQKPDFPSTSMRTLP
jgi:hypothetical protein